MDDITAGMSIDEVENEIDSLDRQKEKAVVNQDFPKAANLRDQAARLRNELKHKRDGQGLSANRATFEIPESVFAGYQLME